MATPHESLPVPVSPLRLPKQFNFATHVVDYWAQKDPNQRALYWTDQNLNPLRELTYSYFSRQSHRVASLLSSLGIRSGETVILILPRIPEWWEVITACLRSGVIPCPCTTLLVDKDIEYRAQISHAAAFIGDPVSVAKVLKVRQNCPTLRQVIQIGGESAKGVNSYYGWLQSIPKDAFFQTPSHLGPKSPALTFFTSGTTGHPKMVLHTQTSYPLAHALTGLYWMQLDTTSIYWAITEQGWAKAAWALFSTWNCGAALFVHDDRLPFSPRRTLRVLNKFPITVLCAPPTVYRQLVLEESQKFFASPEGKPKALKHCCGAGEPLNESVIRTWKQMTNGIEIFDGYGQTETTLTCANQKGNPVKPGSMGKPIPGIPLVIIDADGNRTKDGEEGDIAVEIDETKAPEEKFYGIFDGYINKETNQVDRRLKEFGQKSYYVTGDRASRDADGYFWFVGRGDDVINSSGYRIGPFEVESTLKTHPSVVESAVVASPDAQRDEVVKAFIVLTDSVATSVNSSPKKKEELIKGLQDYCKQNAAPYKYPRKIEFVEASFLPKTISGKIKRAELKKLERERYRKGNGAKI